MNSEEKNSDISSQAEPWDILKEIIDHGDALRLTSFLESLSTGDTARAISRLGQESQNKLLTLLDPEDAADLIEELPEAQAKELIEDLPDDQAAAIVEEMPSDQQADLLGSLDEENAEAILQEMDPQDAEDVRELLNYSPDTAGGLMVTEYLFYQDVRTVNEILEDLQRNAEVYAKYDVLYAYVVDREQRLVGVVKLRDLILSPRDLRIEALMIRNPTYAQVDSSIEDLDSIFDRFDYFGIPIVDADGQLVGVCRRTSVREALESRAGKTFLQASGILGGEELRSLPVRDRAVRRLSVLVMKIGLNLISASVIAAFYDTLSQVVALAVFLPIISDMGGSAGNQAVAVSIRELSLGLIKPYDFMLVLLQELKVGMWLGSLIGLILGIVSYVWKGNIFLGLVIGLALTLNTVIAVAVGGLIPLLMKRLKIDPAIASSAILTTITDALGFFLVLSFASAIITKLI